MEMSEIYNGSQRAHDLFLVNKAGATEYIMGQSPFLIHNLYISVVLGKTFSFVGLHFIFNNFKMQHNNNNNNNKKKNKKKKKMKKKKKKKVEVIPIIIGATGIVEKSIQSYLQKMPGKHNLYNLQRSAILGTAHILRKVLSIKPD